MGRALRWLACCALLLPIACRSGIEPPDLGAIYAEAAKQNDAERNPVIVIPGLLGSRLVRASDERVVWGAFSGDYANPETAEGARLFALPMRPGVPLGELRDDVIASGALESLEIRLFGLSIIQRAYIYILAALGAGGYADEALGSSGAIDYGDEHFTCFQFDYDWRRDVPENARRLDVFLREKKAYVEEQLLERYGVDRDVRFDMVAHSLGGLILRYYLRYGTAEPEDALNDDVPWSGAEHVDRAIIVATPNSGSAQGFSNLVHGVRFSRFLPTYSAGVIGTFPSAYQLLPRERHHPLLDAAQAEPWPALEGLYDVDRWAERGWGIMSPDSEEVLAQLLPEAEPDARREIAQEHLAKCLDRARLVQQALDRPANKPSQLSLHLVCGDAVGTPQRYACDAQGNVWVHEWAAGDGTVLRSSALADEREARELGAPRPPRVRTAIEWDQVLFLFQDHLGLTQDPIFADNLLYLLLESPLKRN